MNNPDTRIKGTYLVGAYICLLALIFVVKADWNWLSNISRWLMLPILILFYYINTAIDSKFEKNIFYGIAISAITSILPIAKTTLGSNLVYLIVALWIIALFCYSRAILSIISGSSSVFYRNRFVAIGVLLFCLGGLYFFLLSLDMSFTDLIPWICLGLASILLFMATINLFEQIIPMLFACFVIGALLLIGYNCLEGLNFSANISIFDGDSAVLFYLGHLLIIFGAVRSCVLFRNNDFTDIASVLNKRKN